MAVRTRSSLLTVASVAMCAAACRDIVHEALGHGIASWIVGDPILSISTVALQHTSSNLLVSAAGTSANLIAGVLSLWFLRRARRGSPGTLFLWLFGAFDLFDSGYLLFSAIAGSGDWASVISGAKPASLWRAIMALVGGTLYFLAVLWVAGSASSVGIRDLRRVAIASYIAAGIVTTAAACFNPSGPAPILVSGVGASFGLNSGLFYIVGSFHEKSSDPVLPFSWSWSILGIVVAILFIFVMGRGIQFAHS